MSVAACIAAIHKMDNMTKRSPRRRSIPIWFLESLDASQETEGALRYVLLELRHIQQSSELDASLQAQLARFQAALEQAAGRLTILQSSTRDALDRFLEEPGGAGGEDTDGGMLER
jgi:hypothetical protein